MDKSTNDIIMALTVVRDMAVASHNDDLAEIAGMLIAIVDYEARRAKIRPTLILSAQS